MNWHDFAFGFVSGMLFVVVAALMGTETFRR
jgi:hypothetical protein